MDMSSSKWPIAWSELADEAKRRKLEAELEREVCPGHLLFREPVIAIAHLLGGDGVLFQLADGRVAYVHLTSEVESKPEWPYTLIFGSVEEFSKAASSWQN